MFPTSHLNRNGSSYRSKRAVPRRRDSGLGINWTKAKIAFFVIGTALLALTTLIPMLMLETTTKIHSSGGHTPPVSLHGLIRKSQDIETEQKKGSRQSAVQLDAGGSERVVPNDSMGKISGGGKLPLARGVSGLPMSKTPALIGAQSGHIDCDVDVDDIVYWNDPQGDRDRNFVSPFATPPDHYLTFEPDPGGWNNIRMSMEIIFVLAATTGRTLVIPPKTPFYLLGTGKEHARSFGSFFSLDRPSFQAKVKTITMEEFLEREKNGLLDLSDEEYKKLKPVAELCLHATGSPINCEVLYEHLRKVGTQPKMQGMKNCLVFDEDYFNGNSVISEDVKNRSARFCTDQRTPVYYGQEMHSPKLIHWNADLRETRLLNHFYGFMYYTNPKIDNFYKRFVRDFLHYNDKIYCAAGKIVHALNAEGKPWSSMHVRRGDLQYHAVKIPAEEWLNNTKEVWLPGEILFIATDERNKTFFDPIREHHDLRFLDDYWDMAKLGDLDSNNLGMIDTIVASHGRAFAGTWFSTFTGYINRMRGYLGYSMTLSWYSWLPRKDVMQEWQYPNGNIPAREWPLGWTAIDGDEWIEHEGEPVSA